MTGYESKRAAAQDKLAQPAQEPLACIGTNGELMWLNKPRAIYSKPIPLYTTPPQPAQEPIKQVLDAEFNRGYKEGVRDAYAKSPQRPWVGLTDEEIDTTWKKWIGTERANKSYTLAIEATLRSKNT